jgi:hypothetical protein
MITDIFARRYAQTFHFSQYHAEQLLKPFFVQVAHIFFRISTRLFLSKIASIKPFTTS